MPVTTDALRDDIVKLKGQMETVLQEGAEGWSEKYEGLEATFKATKLRLQKLTELEQEQVPEKPVKPALKSLPAPKDEQQQGGEGIEAPQAAEKAFDKDRYFVNAIKAMNKANAEACKALQLTVTPNGGWMLPENMIQEIIPELKPQMVFGNLRTRNWPMVDDHVTIRRRTGRASVYWIGENQAIGKTDFSGGQLRLTAKYAAAIIAISNRLINSSQSALVEQSVRDELIEELSIALDYAYLYGVGGVPNDGVSNGAQPTGLSATNGINAFAMGADMDGSTNAAANGAVPTLQDFNYAMSMIERTNVPMRGTMAWIAHPVVKAILRNLEDNEGRKYFWEAPQSAGNPSMLGGYPVYFTTQIPTNLTVGTSTKCTEMFLGEWAHFAIGTPAQMEIFSQNTSDEAFKQNETHIRAITNTDCLAVYPEAFVKLTGILTSL